MDRLLFIVSTERRPLYDGLRMVLGGERGVDVILDRREYRRRQHEQPHPLERRRYARRVRPHEDLEIHERGWTVIRLP
jgi:hypothetical protein